MLVGIQANTGLLECTCAENTHDFQMPPNEPRLHGFILAVVGFSRFLRTNAWVLAACAHLIACNCSSEKPPSPRDGPEMTATPVARSLEESMKWSLRCDEIARDDWEKIDATDWYSEGVEDAGLDYSAAGAHITYWFAWMVENDLHSGFIWTDSRELIREHFENVDAFRKSAPANVRLLVGEVEELHGHMLSDEGNRFTNEHYEAYLTGYQKMFGGPAAVSDKNYARLREVLKKKFNPKGP